TVIVLHPQGDAPEGVAWSATTEALLTDLQRAVSRAGGCFDNRAPARLGRAPGFYLGHAASAAPDTAGSVDPLIHHLEQALQQRSNGGATLTNETATLLRLHDQVLQLKHLPIRGLEPTGASWRPDPRSHLGHNMALARSLLLQVSRNAEVIA